MSNFDPRSPTWPLSGDEPQEPLLTPRSPVFAAVIIDLENRDARGFHEYGGKMKPEDLRDWLQAAYKNALNLCVYLKAELMKRGTT